MPKFASVEKFRNFSARKAQKLGHFSFAIVSAGGRREMKQG